MSDTAKALGKYRICDLSGQLAGAGATKILAAFGAEVIRVEDPVREGRWDILRGARPYVDDRRGIDLGGGFNNHNVEKLGITLNLRTEKGKELLRELISRSDVLTENFSPGVLERLGFPYEELRKLNEQIIYVSNSGFGHGGPYGNYRSWGPVVQAISGLTFESGLVGREPAGWGYSVMDHLGACAMALAVLGALLHRERTGQGQAIDLACVEAAIPLLGPAVLDHTVNGRGRRRPGVPNSNRAEFLPMAPHGIFPAQGEDDWVAIACRDDTDWLALGKTIDEPWVHDPAYLTLGGRRAQEDKLEELLASWTRKRSGQATSQLLQQAGIPSSMVARPEDRIDNDRDTGAWGLWPVVTHREMGEVRVDGLPLHLSQTDWRIQRGAPCLGQDNDYVLGAILGHSAEELADYREAGVL